MRGSTDDILDRSPGREVTGVFHSRKKLDAAAQDLLVAGIDRADIDVSASLDELQRRLNYKSLPAPEIADHPAAARQPFVGKDDVVNADAVAGGIAGCVVAVALAFYLISRGTAPLAVGFFSVLSGLVVGGVAVLLVRRRLRREHTLGLDKLSEAQGLVIWVRVRSPEKEAEAQEILRRHGGEAVHVHEIELAKRPEDLPLHSLRPDPWLGDERLGRP
ncbi:MAG: hypothetical protein QOJ96_99 [Alphaproteobacteria bacterium]|nr:hypothetical protein [Alphaproteobacteria bacterium]